MTVLRLAGAEEAGGPSAKQGEDLAAFLIHLLRWDKAAVVRLQAAGPALAVFGHPPFGPVLAVRSWELTEAARLDATVSVGQLLDSIAEQAATVTVPPGVTGPSWTGLLPPRSGWQHTADIEPDMLRANAARIIAEFRARTEALEPARRTRAELDALAEELWSRRLGDTPLPLRAVHAAHALGFLRPARAMAYAADAGAAVAADEPPALFACGSWLRLRTVYGSIALRTPGEGAGLRLAVAPRGPAEGFPGRQVG
jgi:hypothetical protein